MRVQTSTPFAQHRLLTSLAWHPVLQAEAAQELAERLDTLRQLANELDHDRWRLPEGPTTLL